MKPITYKHATTSEEVIYTAPNEPMEKSAAWARVDGPSYTRMSKQSLVELTVQRGIDAVGTVTDLVERLEADDVEPLPPTA